MGRSHRSKPAMEKIKLLIDLTREVLRIPADYHIGITAGSDTAAIEMAMWSMLGARGVDVFGHEVFSNGWITDIVDELKLPDTRVFKVPFGDLPDFTQADFTRDIVFTWNGTTSGVIVPNGDWISDNRAGLTFCDAISAVFGVQMPWDKLDVTTFSWQKALGGEAQHGMIVLSPRALERLNGHTPPWPIPKIFRLTKKNEVMMGFFKGETINTPSLLCIEDAIDALQWCQSIGGLEKLCARTQDNFDAIKNWVAHTPWVDFFARAEQSRSPLAVTLKIIASEYHALDEAAQREFNKNLLARVDMANAGHDFNNHKCAPPSLRIWCGPTVEKTDVLVLLEWIEWSYAIGLEGLKT
jgi:phosphoserine aminotransferase